MASNTTNFGLVQTLYIAFYQRPADPDGLVFWANEVTTKGRDAVINAFATSDEATALYGAITNDNIVSVVNQIYQALFNRDAEVAATTDAALGTVAGENFYVSGFKAGKFTPGQIALNVFDGVRGTDADVLAKKVAYANEFTAQIDGRPFSDANFGLLTTADAVTYNGDDVAAARAVLQGVTASTTVTPALVSNDVQTSIANAGDATFKLEGTVLNAPAATTQIRATFDSAKVGDGSANNGGTTGAAAFQQEDGADALVGAVLNGSDEGQIYTAKNGQTFDVRDLVTGAQRGNMFTTVNLGTSNGDTLTAAATASYINAGAGNDTVNGGAGADFLVGGAGDDQLSAGNGDSVIGGAGTDTVVVAGNRADYTVADSATAVTLTKGTEVVTLVKVAGVNSTENVKFADATITVAQLLNPTFALTTGVDTIAGTAAAEKITGVVSSLTSEATLNATDVIDGGDGADTLELSLNASFAGFTADKGSMKNVESVVLNNATTISREFNATGVTGATSYTLNASTGAVSLAQLATVAGVTVNGQKEGNLNIGYASKVTDGTADSLSLTVNNVGTAAVKNADGVETAAAKNVALVTTGVETISLTSTGANLVNLSGATGSTSVNVGGAGATTISAVANTVTKFDGSGATGAITADLSGSGTLTSVKTGQGDDKVTVDVTKVAANVTLDGGTGNNTLVVTGAGATLQPKATNFQTLEVSGLAANLVLSGKDVTDLSKVALTGATGNALGASTLTLVGLTAPTISVNTTGAQNGAVLSTSASALTLTTAAFTATAKAQTSADAVSTTLDASEATGLTVNVGAYTNVTGAINVGKATSLAINVESGKNKDATPVEQTVLGSTISAAKAQNVVIDAKGNLTNAVVNAGEATSVVVTTASDANTLTLNTAKATTVQLTAAKGLDLSAVSTDLTGAENLTVTATNGHVNLGAEAVSKANVVNVSGAGTNSQFTVGAIGSVTLDYATSLTAAGLKAGLSTGAIATKASDINVTLNGLTGAATIASVIANADAVNTAGGNVTINAAGQTGSTKVTGPITAGKGNTVSIDASGILGKNGANNAFESGAINAAGGTVTLNASNTLNAVSTGLITAKNVTINAAGLAKTLTVGTGITADNVTVAAASALDTVNVNTISAKTSVTYTGPETKANTIVVTAVDTTNGTKDTLTTKITGGILDDSVTLTSAADALDIFNATIDLGVGTNDSVKLVASANGFTSEALSLTGVEKLVVDDALALGTVTINASAISGKTIDFAGQIAGDILNLRGTTGADTIDLTNVTKNATAGVINITGLAGADTIKLGANVENVVFTAATEGTDTITGFTAADDSIVINGALKTALSGDTVQVTSSKDAAATPAVVATAYAIETAYNGIILKATNSAAAQGSAINVTAANLSDLTKVAALITNSFAFADAGADATANTEIFAIESSDTTGTFGVYAWTQSANNDTTVGATELKLLGIVTADTFTAADITIAA